MGYNGLRGIPRSEETREKIRNTLIGHSVSIATRNKLSLKHTGKKYPINDYPNFGTRGKSLSKETREKISKSNMGRVFSEETRKKISKSNTGKKWTSERKKAYSLIVKNEFLEGKRVSPFSKPHPIEWTIKMAKSMKGKRQSEKCKKVLLEIISKPYIERYGPIRSIEIRRKIGLGNKGKVVSEESRKKIRLARAKQVFPIKDTKIEIQVQNYLKQLGIEFFTHQYINEIKHSYQCDIFIPVQEGIVQKTIIECDGDYWHGNPLIFPIASACQEIKREEDKIRTQELQQAGFRVIRLWETEIKQLTIKDLRDKIWTLH